MFKLRYIIKYNKVAYLISYLINIMILNNCMICIRLKSVLYIPVNL